MARSITEIQTTITNVYVANMAAAGYTIDPSAWSATNLQRLFIYVVAFSTYTVEFLFDVLTMDTNTAITELKPHSLRWYANKAKLYQHGFNLVPESDLYDNTGYTEQQIDSSKIVDYAAVVEQANEFGRVSLRIKLATETGSDLAPLSSDELTGVTEYFQRIKDAGVRLQIDSLPADAITMTWDVYYDPLILAGNGSRLDGMASEPVRDAIKNYLKNLPFNGVYVPTYHIDAVQAVDGVVIPAITEVQVKYGLLPFTTVNTEYLPDAGYLRFYDEEDLIINYIPHSEIR